MKEKQRGGGAAVISLSARRRQRKRAPGRRGLPGRAGGSGGTAASAGSLALQLKPMWAPTPSRWFRDKNDAIGFRLYDAVYIFALARQAMSAEDAIEWGARYFQGAFSEEHGRRVMEALSPGAEAELEAHQLPRAIREAFRDAILQGASELLQERFTDPDEICIEDAARLQAVLEKLYDRNGWLLPAVPYTLHRMLRKAGLLRL